MKIQLFILLILIAGSGCLMAQTSITLDFTSRLNSNDYPTDSLHVVNLTHASDTMLYGNNPAIVLVENVGIPDISSGTAGGLILYPAAPNPFSKATAVRFYLAIEELVTIRVYDLMGREMTRFSGTLQPGEHIFTFYPGLETCYLLSVETTRQRQVQKLITMGQQSGPCRFENTGWLPGVSAREQGKGTIIWAPGDSLRFTCFISTQNNESLVLSITDNPSQSDSYKFWFYMNTPCPGTPTMTDFNGNVYNTVQIGTQCWMKENLRVRYYKTGISIPLVIPDSTWVGLPAVGARCWYQNDSATMGNTYGALYNWYAVVNPNGLCPAGWHVPTEAEWQELEKYLGMSETQVNATGYRGTNEGGSLKEAGHMHWSQPNTGATNSTGFTALPAGVRQYDNGQFYAILNFGILWSSSENSTQTAWYRGLSTTYGLIHRTDYDKNMGLSVRCVRD